MIELAEVIGEQRRELLQQAMHDRRGRAAAV
jgi:hypothetical protein